jgi:hypothetical protein
MSPITPAKIISQSSHVVSGRLRITEHLFDVPKDYSKPDAGTLRIFARSVRKHDTPIVPETSKEKEQLPWMCCKQKPVRFLATVDEGEALFRANR